MHFEAIAFDADDTLWHSETFYQQAQARLVELLAPYGPGREEVLDTLHRIEMGNLAPFGFGIRGFTLSMVEAAIEVTGGRVNPRDIRTIVDMGRAMVNHEVELIDGSAEAVAALAQTHPLLLITKGDLSDQQRKIDASGLGEYFQQVEIVSDKTPRVYDRLLKRHGLNPERFLMIGNSMRSDVLPVLQLGGWAVHVPYPLTWAYENSDPPRGHRRFFEIERLDQLPALVRRLEAEA
ncbi:MAG TPA: HAD family hydrolase [Chloroflexi bacterium]|mgnify:CR=1 FL=1|jgi:putative hydrolase of the HAD superfamily|nr:HAD family hydrolase [Chloroflexota bacterium]